MPALSDRHLRQDDQIKLNLVNEDLRVVGDVVVHPLRVLDIEADAASTVRDAQTTIEDLGLATLLVSY